ncbi:hypothetical protein TNCV_1892641 [Trichonephila clavipes]|nr:hypothetical protein TNCV_1892641 [Trichonephila clavipes]
MTNALEKRRNERITLQNRTITLMSFNQEMSMFAARTESTRTVRRRLQQRGSLPQVNSVSETLTISMETEPHPPSPEELAKCTRMLDTHEYIMVKETRLVQTNRFLMMVRTGILRKNQETYDSMMKEAEDLSAEIQRAKGELALFDTCPVADCQHNTKLNSPRMVKMIEDCTKQLETKLANTHLTATVSGGNSPNISKKNNRQDGFVTPAKVAKKQKVLQNYSFGAATPVNTTNKFQALTGSDALPTQDDTAVPVPPQIPPFI